MPDIRSNAAHSTAVDVSHSRCILCLLGHCSFIHCYTGYEFDFFAISR